MSRKKILLVVLALFTMFLLTGCDLGKNDQPIGGDADLGFIGNTIDNLLAIHIANLIKLFSNLFSNYGIGIILTVIILRGLMWPITSASSSMSAKMALMQPEMERTKAKYAGKHDPQSIQKMRMEQMRLYKKYKINLLSGCLAPLLQMPLFIASYVAVRRFSATFPEVNSMFFSVDLSQSNLVISIIMFVLMLLQNYIIMKKPQNLQNKRFQTQQQQQMQNTMKYVMIGFAVMMFIMAKDAPAAVPFYWMVGSVFLITQNLINKKLLPGKLEKLKRGQ